MKITIRKTQQIFLLLLVITLGSCSDQLEELDQFSKDPDLDIEKMAPSQFQNSNFYTPPSSAIKNNRIVLNTPNNANDGDDSSVLNKLINQMSAQGGGIIEMPRGVYYLSRIKLKSNVQIEIAANTTIFHSTGLTDGSPSRIFDFGGPGQQKVVNSSIYGKGGRFTIDLSVFPINMDVAVARLGEVKNFRLANFNIKDNRTEFASILVSYVDKNGVAEPWSHNGVIQNITQTNAHTGYGLIQGYAADNILFKNLRCTGGVTLRLETDDRSMKAAGKGGMRDVFAFNIFGIDALTPLMFSPHFAQNGRVVVENVISDGCAYAVRVEHGFLEIFANANDYPTNIQANGIRFKNKLESILGINSVSVVYKRNRGKQWAARISNDFTAAAMNSNSPLIEPQLRNILPGKFDQSIVRNVRVGYRNRKGAKIKQAFLRYLPGSHWSKVTRPTGLNMPTGFEYHGPSLGVSFDNCKNTVGNGNYKVDVRNVRITKPFPSNHLLNVKYNSPVLCTDPFSNIN